MATHQTNDRRIVDRPENWQARDSSRQPEQPYRTHGGQLWSGGAGQIIEAAKPSMTRSTHFGFDRDSQRIIRGPDRRAVMSIARWLYWNDPIIRGAINDVATIAAGHLAMAFAGADAAWGSVAETWIDDHDRFCCIRGYPYTMQVLSRLSVVHRLIDGDCFFLLTGAQTGWPLIQFIAANRVRGDYARAGVMENTAGATSFVDSPWAERPVVDGVIYDDFGRPLAYRVFDDVTLAYRDVDAANMIHVFDAESGDQGRGVSALAASIADMSDLGETRKFELLGQKLGASRAFLETNETGLPPSDARQILGNDDALNCDASVPSMYGVEMRGGEIFYARGGTGSKVEAVTFNRPSQDQQAFARTIIRNALHGIGWSIDYSLDPSQIGGAPARIVIEKLNRTIRNIRDHVLFPFRRRVDGWRIAKAEKLGLIPESTGADWRSWDYKGAPDLTADAMYAFQVAEGEISKGMSSIPTECSRRGLDWETEQDKAIACEKRLQEKCKAAGVDPNTVRQFAKQTTQTFTEAAPVSDAKPKDSNGKN